MKQLFFALIALGFYLPGLAQVSQDKRVEIELDPSEKDYEAVPNGKNGIFMYRENDENRRDDEKQWEFRFYNNELEEVWTRTYAFADNLVKVGSYYHQNALYLLFRVRHNKGSYKLIKVLFSDKGMNLEESTLLLPRKYYFDGFKIADNYVYFKGKLKRVPCVVAGNLQTGNVHVIPNPYIKRGQIQELQVDSNGKNMDLIYRVVRKKLPVSIQIDEVNQGSVQSSVLLEPENTNNLYTARMNRLPGGNKIVLGTFGFKKSSGAEGMFYSHVTTDNKPEYIKYYDFIRFQNFFSDLSQKQQARVEKRIKRRDGKGKETRLSVNMLLHKVVEYNNQYVCVGEVYYATYRTETYVCGSNKGIPVYCTRQVFDGWMYSKAVITAFDKEGNLLWDNILEMGDIKSWVLEEKVRVGFEDNHVVLVYATSQTIKSKVIEGNGVVDRKSRIEMSTNFSSDKIKWSNMEVSYWYDNYFLTWGSQKIKNKNKDESGKKKRYVFYFNKVAY